MVWIIVGVLLVIIFIILLFSRVHITCSLTCSNQKQRLTLQFRFYGIRFFTKEIDLAQLETTNRWEQKLVNKDIREKLEMIQSAIRHFFESIRDMVTIAQTFLDKVYFHQLKWHTRIGTGDASTTGMATGGVWATKGMVVGMLDQWSQLKCSPDFGVVPEFNRKYVYSEFDCMVSIRIGQAIHAFFKAIQKSSFRKRERESFI
ncbi:DUF2953 domain-containing protein [Lentibacillus sp. L22]|uniref:DUF2953 domain-containing protein n=1 Tax=Lentibacillus sp. L22 TaxID=3163028 RepID=UPI0034664250